MTYQYDRYPTLQGESGDPEGDRDYSPERVTEEIEIALEDMPCLGCKETIQALEPHAHVSR